MNYLLHIWWSCNCSKAFVHSKDCPYECNHSSAVVTALWTFPFVTLGHLTRQNFPILGKEWSFAIRYCFWGDYSVRSRKIASLLICYARGGIPMRALRRGPQAPPSVPSICLPCIYIHLSFVVNRKFINISFFANDSSTIHTPDIFCTLSFQVPAYSSFSGC
jgi:hypothetical protein